MDAVTDLENVLLRTLRTFRRLLHEEAKARSLTQAQYTAMRQMRAGGEVRMGDLASYLELTNGACTALVEKLAERGLAVRSVDPADGRVVLASLTPAGSALLAEMDRAVQSTLAVAYDQLSIPERHMVVGGLHALADALEA